MSDLVAFLNARLGEDEALAREAAGGGSGEWFMSDKWDVRRAEDEARYAEDYQGEENRLVVYGNVKPQSQHIACHDPARVLREVEAKRALMDEHGPAPESPGACNRCITDREDFAESWPWDSYPCKTLRILAATYSDHLGYRQEWKPQSPS